MSEVHFQIQARFPAADLSARFFRAVYSHGSDNDVTGIIDELEGMGVETSTFLDPEFSWEVEDCGVDEHECFRLKAVADAGPSQGVIGAIAIAASRAGATSVLAILCDTSTGAYQALGTNSDGIVELFTTYDYDEVGDDYASGIRRLLLRAHQCTSGLVQDGVLPPDTGAT